MHCKHCGNQIENDSKFCSFCGGKIEPISQSIPIQPTSNEPSNNPVTETPHINTQNLANSDKGLLVAFALMVGVRLFWFVSDLINKDKSYSDLETYINYVIKPSYIVFFNGRSGHCSHRYNEIFWTYTILPERYLIRIS
ncbi:MAG: zinc ribbon domain-containing protein [Pedobacter sp.]|nr:MAG: zinc ribbon domain-containing protein [Pedobacter sp.]